MHEEFHPWRPEEVERPKLKRLQTELHLTPGPLDATSNYRTEFEPKKAERPQK